MLDADLAHRMGDRIATGVVAATTGFMESMFAAYTEATIVGLDLWSAALSGITETPHIAASTISQTVVPFGQSAEDWSGLPIFDPMRVETWSRMMMPLTPFDIVSAWASVIPLRGSASSWPSAMAMIDSGVPRSVAWPAAEATAAAVDATVAATAATAAAIEPFRKVFATAHGETGYAMQSYAGGGAGSSTGAAALFLAWTSFASFDPFMAWSVPFS